MPWRRQARPVVSRTQARLWHHDGRRSAPARRHRREERCPSPAWPKTISRGCATSFSSRAPQRSRRLSRFWLLLPLSAVIASAGVVSDSTATVIGAMIVAPLMTPILGIVLAVVLTDGANLRRCLLLVIAGAAAVVAVGWLLGLLVPYPVVGHAAGRGHRHLAGAAAGRRRPHPGIRSSPPVAGRAHAVYHQRRGHPGQRHR